MLQLLLVALVALFNSYIHSGLRFHVLEFAASMSSCLTLSVLNISGQGCDARSSYTPAAVLWEADQCIDQICSCGFFCKNSL